MRRALGVLAAVLVTGACAARRKPPGPPAAFPLAAVWTFDLPSLVEGPLATDGERLFVATRDGDVLAVSVATGSELWRAPRGGTLGYGEGLLVAHQPDGTVWGLEPSSGSARWKVMSGVKGNLPPVVDQGRVLVAGEGLVALSRGRGQELWSASPAPSVTTPPLAFGPWIFTGEADGTLRGRDGATGTSLWTLATGHALRAPLLVDDHRRLMVGTTSDRFLAVNAAKGRPHWRWKLGADVQTGPTVVGGRVFVATYEAVLYALKRGSGSMVWRAPLPSRPLAAPILYGQTLLVACAESQIVGFDVVTGKRRGDLQVRVPGAKATPVIRTPPIVLDNRLFIGISNPSALVAFELGAPPPPPAPSPSPEAPAASPSPRSTPSPALAPNLISDQTTGGSTLTSP